MTPSEYEPLLVQAIKESIEDRWIPRTTNPKADVPDCDLCRLAFQLFAFSGVHSDYCLACPFHETDYSCSSLWSIWRDENNKEESCVAAVAIVEKLRSIDAHAWALKLLKMGYLEGEEVARDAK